MLSAGRRSGSAPTNRAVIIVLGMRRTAPPISGLHEDHRPANLSLTISNTCSPSWVFAYQPPLAFDPLKELVQLGRVQYVIRHWQNTRGTFRPVMLTSL